MEISYNDGLAILLHAVLMHDPVGAAAAGAAAFVEDEALLHADRLLASIAGRLALYDDGAVLTGGLPEALAGGAVGTVGAVVLAVEGAEEEPLPVPGPEAGVPGEVPRGPLVELHLRNGVHAEGQPGDLAPQVVPHQLHVRRVEPEPWGEGRRRLRRCHRRRRRARRCRRGRRRERRRRRTHSCLLWTDFGLHFIGFRRLMGKIEKKEGFF